MSSSEHFVVEKPDEQGRRELSPEACKVLRTARHGACGHDSAERRAPCGHCAACAQELFGSDTKFDSGSGWPSFFKPLRFEPLRP